MVRKNIIISEGNRPIWQTCIAAFLYTLALILLGMFFLAYEVVPFEVGSSKGDFRIFYVAVLCIVQGFLFSVVKSIFFDLKKKRYKEQYSVGPIKIGRWKNLPEIDYVSIFKQPKSDGNYIYEVNLWHQRNRHFNVYESINLNPIFEMGKEIAKSLDVDLLDATEPNNHKWIE